MSKYSLQRQDEVQRLATMAELSGALTDYWFQEIISANLQQPSLGIDLGPGSGSVAKRLLSEYKIILNIDRQRSEQLALGANDLFYRADLEQPGQLPQALRILPQRQWGAVTVLAFSLLQHLSSPEQLLSELNYYLPPGSCLLIRNYDDSLIAADQESPELSRILELSAQAPDGPRRDLGSALPEILRRAGIGKFQQQRFDINTSQFTDRDQRRAFFRTFYQWRSSYWPAGSAERRELQELLAIYQQQVIAGQESNYPIFCFAAEIGGRAALIP